MLIKQILGIVAIIIAFISYIPYIRDINKGKTKPHSFSWAVWTILVAVSFAAQISDNAGPGAYINLLTFFICAYIFLISLKYKSNIIKSDYISLFASLSTIPLWLITKNPTYSVLLIIIIDIFSFIPTIRKSFLDPHSETIETYFINSFKHSLSLFALSRYTLITSSYTIYLIIVNFLFGIMLVLRRKQLLNE